MALMAWSMSTADKPSIRVHYNLRNELESVMGIPVLILQKYILAKSLVS